MEVATHFFLPYCYVHLSNVSRSRLHERFTQTELLEKSSTQQQMSVVSMVDQTVMFWLEFFYKLKL